MLCVCISGARTGGAGGPLAPPIFGRSFNPIPTGEGRLSPPNTSGTPNVFHLPASLGIIPIVGNMYTVFPHIVSAETILF